MYESGATHWDTSDAYGESEANIGKWYAQRSRARFYTALTVLYRFKRTGKRNEIFIATKFGFVIEPKEDGRTTCGDPEYAAKAIDRSLNSLGVDYIDLWYLHRSVERRFIVPTFALIPCSGNLAQTQPSP